MMKNLKKLKQLIELFNKWKALESFSLKILSFLGVFFPFLLVGVYYAMKFFFPKQLLIILSALMMGCQSIDTRFLDSMERHNQEIVKNRLQDNADNPEIQRVKEEKGNDYLKELLRGLFSPERSQLRAIFEFRKKIDTNFSKNENDEINKTIDNFVEDWSKNE